MSEIKSDDDSVLHSTDIMSPNEGPHYTNNAVKEEGRIKKKRNRPSLVCFPCRKKKIKCDKGKPCQMCVKNQIADQCEYDERLLAKQEGKRNKKNGDSRASKRRKVLASSEEPVREASVTSPEVVSNEKVARNNGTYSPNSSSDVCVIMKKSELEELQSRLKQYESSMSPPANSRKKTKAGLSSKLKNEDKDKNIVYNRSINSFQGIIFTTHEESRPGYVPLTDVSTGEIELYDSEQSMTKEIHLDDICKRDKFLAGINPYDNPNDVIPLYSQIYSSNDGSKTRNLYPLSWSYSVRNSASLKALRTFAAKQKHKDKGVKAGITYDPLKRLIEPVDERIKSTLKFDESSVSRFEARTKDTEDDKLARERTKSISITPNPVNLSTLALELSVLGGPRDHELTLIEQIQSVMPTRRVIWLHVSRFMYLLYPFFPYLIEDEFRRLIEKIIGKESYDDIKPAVKIAHRGDFAQIGILCVILRLSYLSLFHNRGFHNEKILAKTDLSPSEAEKKYLLLNQIEIGAAEVAQACFRHLERLGRVSIPMLQCGVFLRIYKIYAPEEGDGLEGGNGQIQNSILVSMSYMLGLNREPDKTPDFKDDKMKNLYRKIWYFTVSTEYNSAILYGTPVSIRRESYDTKKPFFTWQNSNSRNKETDQTTIFAFMSTIIGGPIQHVLSMYSNVNGNMKVEELTTHLNFIEQGARKLLGKLDDYLYSLEESDSRYHTNKISKAASLLKLYSFLMLNYCFLFNFYEKSNNTLSYYYLKKMLTLAMGEIIVSGFALITKSQEIFGEGADLFINPIIIQVLTRVSDICIVGIIRTNFSLYKARTGKDKRSGIEYKQFTATLNRFITLMEKCCRICLTGISILSKRYFFAWEVVRSQNYYLKLVTSSAFYKEINIDGLDFAQPTAEWMSEVVDFVEDSLEKFEQSAEKYCKEVGIESLFKKTEPKEQQKPCNNESSSNVLSDLNLTNRGHETVMNTPASVDSTGLYFTGFEDLRFDNSEEIDSVWLQMLSSKTNNQNTGILQYDSLFQQQPSIVNNNCMEGLGYDNTAYGRAGVAQTQYANPYYTNAQAPQLTPNMQGQPATATTQDQPATATFEGQPAAVNPQGQPFTDNIQYQSQGNTSQNPPPQPNLFNYSEMFDDLPLDKLFNQ
ncbi:hypothetical protein CANMA_001178 [Candida margitis]|uniref:uncharacterized protein n=1 Tax=Candida margitis TaxID=1775924 RepID=UPI0022271120|nr:uncharacterized protein CANMA_001178 [Candida margitis]KAI5969804.1 hypothetical protein CANMA_001178 [Candida margitis]